MVRKIQERDQQMFGALNVWVNKNLKSMSVTNLDSVFESCREEPRRLLVAEYKNFRAPLRDSQRETFAILDICLRFAAASTGTFEYWGFYLIQLIEDTVESGIIMNARKISEAQLRDHLSLEAKFCDGYDFITPSWMRTAKEKTK